MLGPVDYIIWLVAFLAEGYVVVRAFAKKDFIPYFSLNFYMLAVALASVGEYYYLQRFGFFSLQYRYFYYYSDFFLTVFLFFAVTGLYEHVFREMKLSQYIRMGAALLLVATAAFSYLVVRQHEQHLTGRFVVELGQNLYFVGVVLTYLLWGAVLKLRETRMRLIQLVLALGIYFSASAATYALRNLFSGLEFLKIIPPVVNTWLPLAWAYTFTKVPEEARLATARLVARQTR
jgi:hypothetical protein